MKPILFNTEMVRAILDGRKAVTRRVVKPQPKSKLAYACMGDGCGKWGYPGKDAWEYWDDERFRLHGNISQDELKRRWTPPCHADDILYVRESWAMTPDILRETPGPVYMADFTDSELDCLKAKHFRWKPSIHMPKEAARMFLRVTAVRVERLQEIDDAGVFRRDYRSVIRSMNFGTAPSSRPTLTNTAGTQTRGYG